MQSDLLSIIFRIHAKLMIRIRNLEILLTGLCVTGFLDLTNQPGGDFDGFHELLTDVDLTGNRLRALPEPLVSLTRLKRLGLRQNLLGQQPESISVVSSLTTLESIDLYENGIKKCPNLSLLVSLSMLDLSFNEIKEIEHVHPLTNLTELYLANNKISTMQGLQTLTNLTTLELGTATTWPFTLPRSRCPLQLPAC
jgi:Leucine-rich repeat (LRR) protein